MIDNPDKINQHNDNLLNEEAEDKNFDEQQYSPGGYLDQKYKHFGFGGLNKNDNSNDNNKRKFQVIEEQQPDNKNEEIKEKSGEEKEENGLFIFLKIKI